MYSFFGVFYEYENLGGFLRAAGEKNIRIPKTVKKTLLHIKLCIMAVELSETERKFYDRCEAKAREEIRYHQHL